MARNDNLLKMITLNVEMYGLPATTTDLRSVEVKVKDGARLRDVVAALRHKVPALVGGVISSQEDHLTEYYTFGVNGQFYQDDSDIRLKSGDHVVLILMATGG
jgi:molybdopterin converting factor small subunit